MKDFIKLELARKNIALEIEKWIPFYWSEKVINSNEFEKFMEVLKREIEDCPFG